MFDKNKLTYLLLTYLLTYLLWLYRSTDMSTLDLNILLHTWHVKSDVFCDSVAVTTLF